MHAITYENWHNIMKLNDYIIILQEMLMKALFSHFYGILQYTKKSLPKSFRIDNEDWFMLWYSVVNIVKIYIDLNRKLPVYQRCATVCLSPRPSPQRQHHTYHRQPGQGCVKDG